MDYKNFDLLITGKAESGYEARVTDSPQGRSARGVPFAVPPGLVQDVTKLKDEQALQTAGSALWNALCATATLRDMLTNTLAVARVEGMGVRLRLSIEPPELRSFPWELLYREPEGFLALCGRCSITRFIAVDGQPIRTLLAPLPLRMLAVLSMPEGLPSLEMDEERDLIKNALSEEQVKGWVEVKFMERATIANVRARLLEEKHHVLHFVGHGQFVLNRAALAFEDEDNQLQPATSEVVGLTLAGLDNLRLVVLNACNTATDSTIQPLVGIAPKIIQRTGVPAVVAMQASISDQSALAFVRQFYSQLASGQTIDDAMYEARLAMVGETGTESPDFAIPVLFIRAADARLVDFPKQAANRIVEKTRAGLEASKSGLTRADTEMVTKWQVQLAALASVYQRMATWKNLHDLLHDLDNAFELVYSEAFRLNPEQPDLSSLVPPWDLCATHLTKLTEFAQKGAQRIIEQPLEKKDGQLLGDPWIVQLLVTQESLNQAIEEGTVRGVLRSVRRFRQAVHTHLNASDKALRDEVSVLGRHTRRLARLLPRTEQGGADDPRSQALNQLRDTFDEIQTMQDRLEDSLQRHDILQDLYSDFTMVRDRARGAPTSWDVLDLEDAWLFCKSDVLDSRLIPFARRSGQLREETGVLSGEPWAVDIARLARELDDLLAEESLLPLPRVIRQFSNTLRQHFFVTDKLLKDTTTELNDAASTLLSMLEAS